MKLDRTITATVYIVFEDKVLLHMHKKHKTLFPLGGHMESYELPSETAIREVLEEAGLDVKLINLDEELGVNRVIQLHRPMHILLENIGKEVENIDFIYYAKSYTDKVNPGMKESRELYWFAKEDIIENDNIKSHIKVMALDAIQKVSEYDIKKWNNFINIYNN